MLLSDVLKQHSMLQPRAFDEINILFSLSLSLAIIDSYEASDKFHGTNSSQKLIWTHLTEKVGGKGYGKESWSKESCVWSRRRSSAW